MDLSIQKLKDRRTDLRGVNLSAVITQGDLLAGKCEKVV